MERRKEREKEKEVCLTTNLTCCKLSILKEQGTGDFDLC